jgi:DNA-binding CsgD family transcriptional regulator
LTLVGRAQEQDQLGRLVVGAHAGMSQALVIRGQAGIGKTALVDDLVDSAPDLRTIRISGIEAELELPYAALHALLLPFQANLGGLPSPQREAISTAFGLFERPSTDPFLVGLAALSLLTDVSSAAPLLCIVDDAQWLDQESSRVLAFVARRLLADRIVLLLCVREPFAGTDPFRGLPEMLLGGLGEADASELLEEAMGLTDRRVAQRVISAAEGNPLALKEFAANLSPSQRMGEALILGPLGLSRRLEDHFLLRIQNLSTPAQRLLLLAAAEPSGDLELLLRAIELAGIALAESLELECQEFLQFRQPVVFRHPLIRSAVYGGSTPEKLRLVHGLLANATDPELDPDRYAWHRAAASPHPDEEIAAALERSANRAHARGGLYAEGTLLVRAGQLTPNPVRRATRWLSAAEAILLTGGATEALALLSESEPNLSTPLLRAESLRIQAGAMAMSGHLGDVPLVFAVAARALQPLDPRAARVAWVGALNTVISTSTLTKGISAQTIAEEALAAPEVEDSGSLVDDDLLTAFATRIARGYTEAAPMFRQLLSRMTSSDHDSDLMPGNSQLVSYAAQDIWDSDGADAALSRLADRQRSQGALLALRFTLTGLERSHLWRGRFEEADSFSSTARDVTLASGTGPFLDLTDVQVHALRGHDVETRTVVSSLESIATMVGVGQLASISQLSLAVLNLSRGRYEDALASAQIIFDEDPIGLGSQILPEYIEAAVRSGNLEARDRGLDRLHLRATICGTAWALGLLARCRAISASGSEAEQHFSSAIELLTKSNMRLDTARTHLLFGEWLRRQRRQGEAREQLDIAYQTFVDIGADGFADRASSELKAAGSRSRPRPKLSSSTLTPQEDRVAKLAARGATNREIAAEMFISQATVAYHLTKVYRKLNVSTRRKLARLLSGG